MNDNPPEEITMEQLESQLASLTHKTDAVVNVTHDAGQAQALLQNLKNL